MLMWVADQADAGGHECASGYHILFSHKMTIGFQYAVWILTDIAISWDMCGFRAPLPYAKTASARHQIL